MVFGTLKMGKSFLCIRYLVRNREKVLYIANEEGLNLTLQEKLNDKNVKHPNFSVTSRLQSNLNSYDFTFLNSVNRLGLTVEDLRLLKSQYPSSLHNNKKIHFYHFAPRKCEEYGLYKTNSGYYRKEDIDRMLVREFPKSSEMAKKMK